MSVCKNRRLSCSANTKTPDDHDGSPATAEEEKGTVAAAVAADEAGMWIFTCMVDCDDDEP